MKLCNSGHQEICYVDSDDNDGCPLCEAKREIESLQRTIDDLDSEIYTLEEG